MSERPARSVRPGVTGIYVYGVVPAETPEDVFADVPGVDPEQPVGLVVNGDAAAAAVTSGVALDEFGGEAIEANLRDPTWLEEKARAHDAVLGAAVGRVTVVPFRFGAIYESEEHVRELLAERRDIQEALSRLAGAVELGVGAYVDRERLRARLAAERGVADVEASGRAYMERRRLERELDDAVARVLGERAQAAHDCLAAAAVEAHANAVRPSRDGRLEMLLNGAYLVRDEPAFRAVAGELASSLAADGVVLDVTGPWPPYNFAAEPEAAT